MKVLSRVFFSQQSVLGLFLGKSVFHTYSHYFPSCFSIIVIAQIIGEGRITAKEPGGCPPYSISVAGRLFTCTRKAILAINRN